MSSLYEYLQECFTNNSVPDMEIFLLKSEKYLIQTAREFPDYIRDDLIQEARLKLFEKFPFIQLNWNTLKSHKRKLEHYIRAIIRNTMKNFMQKETFVVSINITIPNIHTITYPQTTIPDYTPPNIAFSTAINYAKRQISNGLLVSPNVLNQLLPNPKLKNTIIHYAILNIKLNCASKIPYIKTLPKGGKSI